MHSQSHNYLSKKTKYTPEEKQANKNMSQNTRGLKILEKNARKAHFFKFVTITMIVHEQLILYILKQICRKIYENILLKLMQQRKLHACLFISLLI